MKAIRITAVCWLLGATFPVAADAPTNGQLRGGGAEPDVWSDTAKAWVTPETFWVSYAESGNGVFWGRTATYPEYERVNEHDTILIETDRGPCLMEFFHTRWRRANDVRRWDEGFNDYGGCPYVFD